VDCGIGENFDDWLFTQKAYLDLDWCFICKCNGEKVDHLLLHCPIAMELWSMMLGLFAGSLVIPKSVVDLLACWQGRFG